MTKYHINKIDYTRMEAKYAVADYDGKILLGWQS